MKPVFMIVNDIDRPCARLVVVVDEEGHGRYLSDRVDQMDVSTSGGTLIEKFGCEIKFQGYQYTVTQVRESEAQYSGGAARRWQDEQVAVHPLKEEFWPDGPLSFLVEGDR